MALITDKNVKTFDTDAIHKGDCIRFKRAGSSCWKNGFVTRVTEQLIDVLHYNAQSGQTNSQMLLAVDVAIGVYEVYWTTDFKTVNYENNVGTPAVPTPDVNSDDPI